MLDAARAAGGDAVDAAVGLSGACAVKADGALWCFGDTGIPGVGVADDGTAVADANQHGEVGDGTTTEKSTPVTASAAPGPVRRAVVTERQTCVQLQRDDSRYWGWNASGELGDGTTTTSSVPVTVLLP